RIPVRVDAESLDVDALLIHGPDALRGVGHEQGVGLERSAHQRHGARHRAVRVHVHGLDALAGDDDLAPPPLRSGRSTTRDERGFCHCVSFRKTYYLRSGASSYAIARPLHTTARRNLSTSASSL